MIFKPLLKFVMMPLMGISIFVLVFSVSIYGYSRLTDESLIAEIIFDKQSDQTYLAHLTTVEYCQTVEYFPIYGDQWRIDALFIKWKSLANLIGLDSRYRLDRLEGRYKNIIQQNRGPHHAHSLAIENALDIASLSEYLGDSNSLLDTQYGSSAYKAIEEDQIYQIYRSQSGLFVRAIPVELELAGRTQPSVEMARACGVKKSWWQRTTSIVTESLYSAVNWLIDKVV
ncbi:MAG: hypothetical protein KUG72_06390 [Pseudomonadales bacterium]|nr:hypothetical protein [Pseudomonadales bacterium]